MTNLTRSHIVRSGEYNPLLKSDGGSGGVVGGTKSSTVVVTNKKGSTKTQVNHIDNYLV